MEINVIDESQLDSELVSFLEEFVPKALTKLSACQVLGLERLLAHENELSLLLVGAGRMQQLNAQYRGQDRVTDVLSFSGPGLGDLALCVPRIHNQAAENGHSAGAEAVYLTIHGVLHLLGYDHEEGRDVHAKEMFEVQDVVFDHLRSTYGLK